MSSIKFNSRSTNGVDLPSMDDLRAVCDGDVVRINIPIKAKNPDAPRFESAWITVEDGGATVDYYTGDVKKTAKTKLTGTVTTALALEAFHHIAQGDRITFERNKIVEIILTAGATDAEVAQ
jgi:hypothetical protein